MKSPKNSRSAGLPRTAWLNVMSSNRASSAYSSIRPSGSLALNRRSQSVAHASFMVSLLRREVVLEGNVDQALNVRRPLHVLLRFQKNRNVLAPQLCEEHPEFENDVLACSIRLLVRTIGAVALVVWRSQDDAKVGFRDRTFQLLNDGLALGRQLVENQRFKAPASKHCLQLSPARRIMAVHDEHLALDGVPGL